jgi:chromosome partitioning protein
LKTIAFFNNKGGVGKTTLVYHLAWMFSDLGINVVVADLDPQSNVTSAFLDDDRIGDLWEQDGEPKTILGAVDPLLQRLGDIQDPYVEDVSERIGLIPGDLALNLFEDRLAEAWPKCLDDNDASRNDAFRVTTAFRRVMRRASKARQADLVLIDVGPNLGAIEACKTSAQCCVPGAEDGRLDEPWRRRSSCRRGR